MGIIIKEVIDKQTLNDFVKLPYVLYKSNKYWVPPMINDERNALIPDKNPAFDFCKVKLWVAYKNNKCVGRIGGIINSLWIEKEGKKIGRFTRTEFIDDIEVSSLLLSTAEKWLKEEGMVEVQGPLGFSNLDHQGCLIEGHDWLPSVASDYHMDYYLSHFEKLGYEKEIDWLEFRITFPEALPEKSYKVAEMLIKRYGLKPQNFTSSKEIEPYKEKVFALLNKAFAELFGTFPLPEKLIEFYISKFFPMLNPRYVKIILDKDDEMAGFLIALPSLSKAMQKANGKLFPFGWWHIMRALKKPTEMDLMLTGVKPELQRMGVAALLMNDLWKTANDDGIKQVETTGMLENNNVAIQMWKSFDHIQHKRKRCFKKTLN
ncbi:GNAT family N-acetyltransferase [Carboxylicivirga sp. N1Y90]|uniref:GNAT family N-acetyltransferase n=1 Tax=Carboxylicivirga fragile TaxID=3417571 RepID=UPI003D34AB6F|nr:GNAT family N-acetyltransferase [Marinilabiliaceae bacterium N1Y90]